jgi:hypothetical protein
MGFGLPGFASSPVGAGQGIGFYGKKMAIQRQPYRQTPSLFA